MIKIINYINLSSGYQCSTHAVGHYANHENDVLVPSGSYCVTVNARWKYIRHITCLAVVCIFLLTGLNQAFSETPAKDQSAPQLTTEASTPNPSINPGKTETKNDIDNADFQDDIKDEATVKIADPLEKVNRVMYQFNDKLYFWMLKPVAQGYNKVLPEPARISVKNFFSNLGFPIRFLSCLLQANLKGAATEAGRFTVNTVWGIGGFMDISSGKELNLQKQETDLGLTLASYGVGHGFYIVWPFLGPSSLRDSISIPAEYFLYPVSYIEPWYAWLGVRTLKVVNDTSLQIGDYESMKEAAIDPYVSMRDIYIQYRLKTLKQKGAPMITGPQISDNENNSIRSQVEFAD
ncbi:MAG: VacJ family lipoprotein [Smithella sp.]